MPPQSIPQSMPLWGILCDALSDPCTFSPLIPLSSCYRFVCDLSLSLLHASMYDGCISPPCAWHKPTTFSLSFPGANANGAGGRGLTLHSTLQWNVTCHVNIFFARVPFDPIWVVSPNLRKKKPPRGGIGKVMPSGRGWFFLRIGQ